jgi:hypothetical protein
MTEAVDAIRQPFWKKFNTIRTHLYLAAALRVFLIAYGEYQVMIISHCKL